VGSTAHSAAHPSALPLLPPLVSLADREDRLAAGQRGSGATREREQREQQAEPGAATRAEELELSAAEKRCRPPHTSIGKIYET
jgi:hypothetical protein